MLLLDYIYKYSLEKKDFPILEDEIYGSLSFSELEQYSGRIYNYLLNKEFNKEEIIVIKMKRSYKVFISIIAIWKRGLPFVIIGDHSPQEYIHQVIEECHPSYILDDNEYDLAIKGSYKEGYELVNDHDLAYIVYSTGSTGIFKGSMHEFGAINSFFLTALKYTETFPWEYEEDNPNVFLFIGGTYSITTIVNFLDAIVYTSTMLIISYEHCNDINYLIKVCKEKKLYSIDASPRTLPLLVNANIDTLKEIVTSYEMSSVKYLPNIKIYNCYGMSEALGVLSYFVVDNDYDICPIGKNLLLHNLTLLDEDDKQITSPNTIGEFAFIPSYCRGYIAHQDLYQKAFYNGFFHTRDMGYINNDGNYVCVGRKQDIYKLDKDKYIVPVFISVVIKRTFIDITKCYIKIFNEGITPYIVLYYKSNTTYTVKEINKRIKDKVPSYSLLTHIEKVDDLDYYFCGKVNRNSYQLPNKSK